MVKSSEQKKAREEKGMKRSYANEISEKDDGRQVLVMGWVSEIRDLNKIRFIVLRDMGGSIQITALKEKAKVDIFNLIPKITKESAIAVKGKVVKSKQAPGGREILPDAIEILAYSEPILPILAKLD